MNPSNSLLILAFSVPNTSADGRKRNWNLTKCFYLHISWYSLLDSTPFDLEFIYLFIYLMYLFNQYLYTVKKSWGTKNSNTMTDILRTYKS